MEKPVAVVTGASRGIGRAIAEELSRSHRVVATYRGRKDAAESLQAATGAEPVQCDIASGEDRERLIAYLHAQAAKHLRAGKSVIVTGTFLDHDSRAKQEKLARRNGADFIGLYLHAPLGTLYDRVAKRTNSASDATPSVVKRQFKGASKRPMRDLPWCVIRADKSQHYVLDSALHHIRRHVAPREKLNPAPKKTFKSNR